MHGIRGLRKVQSDERGAFLVLFALLLVAMLGMAALVLDAGGLRQDRRADRTVTDFAASGAAFELGAGAEAACLKAWSLTLENLDDEGAPLSPPDCAGIFGGAFSCDPTTGTVATGTAPPYTIRIIHGVPDDSPLMLTPTGGSGTDQTIDSADGAPCERIAVEVTRSRDFAFAPVVDDESGTTTVHSVALALTGTTSGDVVNLLLLDTTGCDVLVSRGQAEVLVKAIADRPGFITIDSDTSDCGHNAYTVDVKGTDARIHALGPSDPVGADGRPLSFPTSGRIGLYGMNAGQTNCATGNTKACQQSDVDSNRLSPQPNRLTERIGRDPVEHRYNCQTSYTDLGNMPNNDPWVVAACDEGTDPYVKHLKTAIGTGSTAPSGFKIWSRGADQLSGTPDDLDCTHNASEADPNLDGNWYVDCSNKLSLNATVTFTGGNVVFQKSVEEQSGGALRVNTNNPVATLPESCRTNISTCTTTSAATHAVVYLGQGGALSKAGQASLELDHVMVYIHSGWIDLAGGNTGRLKWVAPTEGPFEDLLLWSEQKNNSHKLAGQGQLEVEGVLYAPNADVFSLSGNGVDDQAKAQFITWNLDVGGNGLVTMQPDPDRVVLIPKISVELIR